MGDKELVDTRDSAWTACKGSDAERDIAGLRAVAATAWTRGAQSAFFDPEIRGQVSYPDDNPYSNPTATEEAH